MPISHQVWRVVLGVWLIGIFCAHPGLARLKPEDRVTLTGCLEKIARTWHQPSVDQANSILTKADYTEVDWEDFWRGYFRDHPVTDELRTYLAYPIFGWFDERVHRVLQKGLWPVLVERVMQLSESRRDQLASSLQADRPFRESLFNLHRLAQVYLTQPQSAVSRKQIFRFYQQQVKDHPQWFAESRPLVVRDQTLLGALRVQVLNNLVESVHRGPLNPELDGLDTVGALVGLDGLKLRLWRQQHILVIDNGFLDSGQLEAMLNYFEAVPAGLPRPWVITQYDALGATGPGAMTLFATSSINIFGNRLGSLPENQFPSDVPARQSDIFLACLAHEANHIVNAQVIEKDARLNARQKALIAAAGKETQNYLRSMLPSQTFVKAPQEFFASMANQWFCDSEYTLQLGLTRFSQGYHEPLNQAVFFAEVYSQGGSFSWFYTAGPGGALKGRKALLSRDRYGHINSLPFHGARLWLKLDSQGNVLSVGKSG